jgi:hypothetical protein
MVGKPFVPARMAVIRYAGHDMSCPYHNIPRLLDELLPDRFMQPDQYTPAIHTEFCICLDKYSEGR